MSNILLSINDLCVHFETTGGTLKAVDGVSLDLDRGQVLGLVGESGGGKSMVGLSILRLIPEGGKIVNGEITFEGKNLLNLSDKEMRAIRGAEISMILQDPLTSLNPVFKIGPQIMDVLKLHKGYDKKDAKAIALQMLSNIGIPAPNTTFNRYPHQLSGGMRQRVMIAIAFCCNPKLIIADEPTTALDVTIQAQILSLLKELSSQFQTSVIFITHSLGTVANLCNRVAVIYAGEIMEAAPTHELFTNPMHPYTKALFRSIPRHDIKMEAFHTIEGTLGTAIEWPNRCNFFLRCTEKTDACEHTESIAFTKISRDHVVRCTKYV